MERSAVGRAAPMAVLAVLACQLLIGFRAAAARGMVLTISALVKRKVPEKVFATVEEAARWLAPLAGEEADALARAAAAVIEVR